MNWEKVKEKLSYLDPYKYVDLFVEYLHNKDINYGLLDLFIYIVFSLFLALIVLKFIGLIMGTSQAIMIVQSGSMIPTLNIGDIVILKAPTNINTKTIYVDLNLKGKHLQDFAKIDYNSYYELENKQLIQKIKTLSIDINGKKYDLNKTNDIIVYNNTFLHRPVIHRAMFKIVAKDGNYYITKGDNENTNFLMDEDCTFGGCIMPYPILEKQVEAKYLFKIPYVGLVKIWIFRLLGLM